MFGVGFGCVWLHLAVFGCVCFRFGPVWACLVLFGSVWPWLSWFGSVCHNLAVFGSARLCSALLGLGDLCLALFGTFRPCLIAFGVILPCLWQFSRLRPRLALLCCIYPFFLARKLCCYTGLAWFCFLWFVILLGRTCSAPGSRACVSFYNFAMLGLASGCAVTRPWAELGLCNLR